MKVSDNIMKILLLTFDEHDEKAIDKIIATISDCVSPLVLLASNPGIVLTRTQIFESVWSMDSDSCHSNVGSVICNLRKKIEPDSKKPTYIKTVLGVGYKFNG